RTPHQLGTGPLTSRVLSPVGEAFLTTSAAAGAGAVLTRQRTPGSAASAASRPASTLAAPCARGDAFARRFRPSANLGVASRSLPAALASVGDAPAPIRRPAPRPPPAPVRGPAPASKRGTTRPRRRNFVPAPGRACERCGAGSGGRACAA